MQRKISLALGVLIFIVFIQGAMFLVLLSQVRTASEELNDANSLTTEINFIEMRHYRWLQSLSLSLYTGAEFEGILEASECSLGQWVESGTISESDDKNIHEFVSRLQAPHDEIHTAAQEILKLLDDGKKDEAESIYYDRVIPNMDKTVLILDEINTYGEGEMKEKQNEADSIATFTVWLMLGITAVSVIIGVILMLTLMKKIVPPLKNLTKAADALASGDIDIKIDVQSDDELGRLATSFKDMADGIMNQAEIIQKMSQGDYTMEMNIRGENDVINNAIKNMLDQTNSMINELRQASDSVALGASHISSGSNSLASGSSEQAAKLQELTASLEKVKEKAEENSTVARNTMKEVAQAEELMGESTEYMKELNSAMGAINESSKEIAKVIRIIEDIAFQTNLLSLNAAVEAARAGQHGKGFAVVAEEVKNLAGKSAAAAKETAVLIENSIQNVTKGAEITKETNNSINQVNAIVESNAEASEKTSNVSEEQKQAVGDISEGLDGISRVVYENSSTAEESAANAEALHAQSELLKSIVSRFKIK